MNRYVKYWFLLGTLCLSGGVQADIPPVFGSEYKNRIRQDELERAFVYPRRVIWMKGKEAELIQGENLLLKPGSGQVEFGKKNMCLLKSLENEGASLLLDYGKELHGGLQLLTGSSSPGKPVRVRVRFGESVGECNSELAPGKARTGCSTNDHAMRDMELKIPRDGMIEVGNTGFRFVRIDLLEKNAKVYLKEARAVLRYRDIPYVGSFRSSDARLDSIWLTGAYTVHLNMQDYLWDGIKRDRVIWLGDMHPEVATICTVFGGNEVVPRTLDLACRQFPLPAWMNGMSAYSLWYLIIQHDWYMHQGDLDFLRRHKDYITGLVSQIDQRIESDGKEHLASSRFLDWPSSSNPQGVEAGYRALIVWALQDAEYLCRILGDAETARKAHKAVDKIKRLVKPDNGLKQAAALMAIAGLQSPEEACSKVIAAGGAQGFSTFYGYYMLEALARAGRYEEAMDIMRAYWGGMLDLGATTFWEDFNLEWARDAGRIDEPTPNGKKDIHGSFGAYCYPGYRHSLCHGWASGPTAWLGRHVLGIEVVEPGCRKVKIAPHLGHLQWVEGTFPTPYGPIEVKHVRGEDGRVESVIHAPEEVEVIRRGKDD